MGQHQVFQDGCDSSQFESRGYSASGEGGVNYVGDHGRQALKREVGRGSS